MNDSCMDWIELCHAPTLAMGETHLWRVELHALEDACDIYRAFLSPQERGRADRFKNCRGKRNFMITRGILRWLLSQYTGILTNYIELRHSEHGKPWLPSIHFNVSHSRDYALLVFSRCDPLGVDIEHRKESIDCIAIAERYFAPSEIDQIKSAEDMREARSLFFAIWTRKEAYIKALGSGLYRKLGSIALPLGVDHVDDSEDSDNWQVHSFLPARDYYAAVCRRTPPTPLAAYAWTPAFCQL